MIAVEENVFQSNKTDASLHIGRPTGTGAQYHRVGAASNPPSIQINKDGVTVEEVLDALNIECYAPMHYKQIVKSGKKHIITESLTSSFIFVHSSQEEVDTMLHEKNGKSIESRSLLSYYYDHSTYRQDNLNRNPSLVICDEAMNNFIKLTSAVQRMLGGYGIYTEKDDEESNDI